MITPESIDLAALPSVALCDRAALPSGELFVNRRNPNATWYPAPLGPKSIRITEEAIRNRVQEDRRIPEGWRDDGYIEINGDMEAGNAGS